MLICRNVFLIIPVSFPAVNHLSGRICPEQVEKMSKMADDLYGLVEIRLTPDREDAIITAV